ncbi:MAG: hypothetical protein QOD56_2569 [Gammaproteobacteria bacterium]|nr:hypothetical protein [Gammaproteobacteria bacterium]
MTHDPSSFDLASEHREVSALLAWYVNDTLGERDRQRVDLHLRTCTLCRDDLLLERRLYEGMSAESGVDYIPAVSLKRLNARLDQLGTDVLPASPAEPSRGMRWTGVMAASIAAVAVAVGLVITDQWMQRPASLYQTVTTANARSPDEVIRAVFSPSITLVDLQAILDEAQLRIISGPTEAGVYSLAAQSNRPVSSSLALLRQHAAVRFAESTRPDRKPGASP